MRDEKTKRDRNAANADNCRELKYFAKRNKVSMDEARALIGQFGDDRPTASGNAIPKARPTTKALASQTRLAKGPLLGD
jgi:hypothetical protein